jgi:hypothetical protein
MRAVGLVAGLVAVAASTACRVPEVDLTGKACPCAEGYDCDDTRDVCVLAVDAPPPDASPLPDGEEVDAPPAAPCLGSAPGNLRFQAHFDAPPLIDWTIGGGSWSITGINSQLIQSDPAVVLAYAYPNAAAALVDYRVVTKMRQIDGAADGGLEVAFRVQSGSDGQYACKWEPNSGRLALEYLNPGGSGLDVMNEKTINLATIPGYDVHQVVVMEVQVVGAQLDCCLRGIPGGTIGITDSRYTTGGPGAKTSTMSAGFDDYEVYDPP